MTAAPADERELQDGGAVTLEGEVRLVRHETGLVEILEAPPITRISLELLAAADPVVLKASGKKITFGGQVVYEITRWEPFSCALVARLVEDRRPGLG